MSPVALGMDLLLALLLLAALMMGARLNGRLKALRESHAGFAKAVAELDAAAARAEAGLAAIRRASEDSHDDLLRRIETARALSAKLERATQDAQKAVDAASTVRPSSLAALASLTQAAARAPEPAQPQAPAAAPAPRRPLRSMFDDDLFESGDAPLRRTAGDRR